MISHAQIKAVFQLLQSLLPHASVARDFLVSTMSSHPMDACGDLCTLRCLLCLLRMICCLASPFSFCCSPWRTRSALGQDAGGLALVLDYVEDETIISAFKVSMTSVSLLHLCSLAPVDP